MLGNTVESELLQIDVGSISVDDGKKRYHRRIELLQRAEDMEDLKTATAAVVQKWDEYNDAVARTARARGERKSTLQSTHNVEKRSRELDEQVEVLYGITKRLRREVSAKTSTG
jgi:ABC-type polar amino acid transport system ATPase subunit